MRLHQASCKPAGTPHQISRRILILLYIECGRLWMQLYVLLKDGLVSMLQHPETLIPIMAEAARRAASGAPISRPSRR